MPQRGYREKGGCQSRRKGEGRVLRWAATAEGAQREPATHRAAYYIKVSCVYALFILHPWHCAVAAEAIPMAAEASWTHAVVCLHCAPRE